MPKIKCQALQTTRNFELPGNTTASVVLKTGKLKVSFPNLNIRSNALEIPIYHAYSGSSTDHGLGSGWQLSIHQKVFKKGRYYFYTDGNGVAHKFEEIYFYEFNNRKIKVNRSDVSVLPDGTFWITIDGRDIQVQRKFMDELGLVLNTEIKDIQGIDYLEQRNQDQRQVDDAIRQKEDFLRELVIVDNNGVQHGAFNLNTNIEIAWKNFSNHAKSRLVTDKATAIHLRQLIHQRDSNVQRDSLLAQRDSLTTQRNQIITQRSMLDAQIHSLNVSQIDSISQAQFIESQRHGLEQQRRRLEHERNHLQSERDALARRRDAANNADERAELENARLRVVQHIVALNASDGQINHIGGLVSPHDIVSNALSICSDDDNRPIEVSVLTQQAILRLQASNLAGNQAAQVRIRNAMQSQRAELTDTETRLTEQITAINEQLSELVVLRNQVIKQINHIIRQSEILRGQLPDTIKDYKQLLTQRKQIDLMMPISQVVNDGVVLGFNRYGYLCYISDSFDNAFQFIYETIGTSHGKNDRLTSIVCENTRCDLVYNLDGRLTSIINDTGCVSSFDYLSDQLIRVVRHEGDVDFSYEGAKLIGLSSGNITSEFKYQGNRLKSLLTTTYIDTISDLSVTHSDVKTLSAYEVSYNNEGSYVRIFDTEKELTEYHYLDDNGMSYSNYSTFNDDSINDPITFSYMPSDKTWALSATQDVNFLPIFEQKQPLSIQNTKKIVSIKGKQLAPGQLEYMMTATAHTVKSVASLQRSIQTAFRSENTSNSRKYEIRAIINYIDGTNSLFVLGFNTQIIGHQALGLPITLSEGKEVKEIVVHADFRGNNATAVFDGFRLLVANYEYTKLNDWQQPTFKENSIILLSNDSQTYEKTIAQDFAYDDKQRLISQTTNTRIFSGDTIFREDRIRVNQAFNASGVLISAEEYNADLYPMLGKDITEYTYDEKGNVTREIRYNSNSSVNKFIGEFKYDEYGIITESFDDLGRYKNKYVFDKKQGTSSITKPNTAVIGYGFDKMGRLTGINESTESDIGNPNYIRYNEGLPTKLSNSSNIINYEYDYKHRLTKVLINDNERLSYEYEKLVGEANVGIIVINDEPFTSVEGGYITREVKPLATINSENDKQSTILERWQDEKERLVLVGSEGLVYQAYHYNDENTIAEVADGIINDITKYEYDPSTKQLIKSSNSNNTHEYHYNNKGQLETKIITGKLDRKYSFTYKSYIGQLDKIVLPNSLEYYPKYDLNDRPVGKIIKFEDKKIFQEKILYTKVGNRTSITPAGAIYLTLNGDTYSRDDVRYVYDSVNNITHIYENECLLVRYGYDLASRLIREDNKELGFTQTITYDSNGNILSKKLYDYTLDDLCEREVTRIDNYGYCIDDADKLLSFNDSEISYNEIGDPLIYKGKDIEYDNDKIIKFGENTFEFDGYFNRIKKNDVEYIYDNEHVLSRIIDNDNTLDFIRDTTGVVSIIHNETSYMVRRNIFGDITHIHSLMGDLIVKYKYDAYGNHKILDKNGQEIADKNHVGHLNPYRYRGYFYDAETNLYYLKTRYYDPTTGRFISADHTSYLRPDIVNGLNLYAYCGNNPVMNFDSDGTLFMSLLIAIGIGAAVGALVSGVNAAVNGANWYDALGAAVGGAIFGAAIGAAGFLGAKAFAGGTIIGAIRAGMQATIVSIVGGFTSYTVETSIRTDKDFTAEGLAQAGLNGLVQGWIAFSLGAIGASIGAIETGQSRMGTDLIHNLTNPGAHIFMFPATKLTKALLYTLPSAILRFIAGRKLRKGE